MGHWSYYNSSRGEHEQYFCIKFYGNLSNCCRDISHKTAIVKPHSGLRQKVSGSPKSVGFILRGPWMAVQKFIAIHPQLVEIFQSGPKWWSQWHCHTFSHAAAVAKKRTTCNVTRTETNGNCWASPNWGVICLLHVRRNIAQLGEMVEILPCGR